MGGGLIGVLGGEIDDLKRCVRKAFMRVVSCKCLPFFCRGSGLENRNFASIHCQKASKICGTWLKLA
jgi:hypothetical protein